MQSHTVMKNNFWNWLFPNHEVVEEECPTVFVGTTADLLSAVKQTQEEETYDASSIEVLNGMDAVPEPELAPEPEEEPVENLDKQWLNLEFLKLAFQIEESKSKKVVTYVDVGNLPKLKAEAYIKEVKAQLNPEKDGDYWLPRREGGRGTEVNILPARTRLEDVIATATALKNFSAE
jgi:hypothetical protein